VHRPGRRTGSRGPPTTGRRKFRTEKKCWKVILKVKHSRTLLGEKLKKAIVLRLTQKKFRMKKTAKNDFKGQKQFKITVL
jgi:hypothetical protein